MASSHPRQDDPHHRPNRGAPMPPPLSHPHQFAQGPPPPPPQHMFAGGQRGMPVPLPYATHTPPGFMPYAMPQQPKAPKIRHPNRPPCTVPSKTLYIRNLRESTKIPVLVKALKTLFETYGDIVEVRARHSIRMRGQAFVVFNSIDDATRAHHEVQGFVLFGKPMFIEFSRAPSDTTVVNEGGDIEEHTSRRKADKENREKEANELAARIASAPPAAAAAPEPVLPNKILFLQGLPVDIKVSEIESVFSVYPGFVEVRWVSVKPDVAFVEYESDAHADIAKSTIGIQWSVREDQPPVSVSFARR